MSITITLTLEQARLVREAIVNQLNTGYPNAIPVRQANALDSVKDELTTQINLDPTVVEQRILSAVEDYCDACNYSNYKSLTDEDIDYLASELQLSRSEFTRYVDII